MTETEADTASRKSAAPAEPAPTLGQRAEAVTARALYGALGLLPADLASGLMGRLLRMVGPLIPVSRVGRDNLARAFPEKTRAEREAILRGMWENLGRIAGEYPHVHKAGFLRARMTVNGLDTLEAMRDDGIGGLFFSAHVGNWEVSSYAATAADLPLHRFYRAANNPLIEATLYRRGRSGMQGELLPKGRKGAARALGLLKRGGHVAIMADQKQNEGIPVPFFGRDAMTTPAVAEFALRLKLPVIPTRTVRLGGARFRVDVGPPMEFAPTGDHRADVAALTAQITQVVEGWVREHPDQWLWVHRRWPKG
ncbi:Lipid A biosynthesis lauroyl acyltransferase [Caenispirillum salinarum AK4]|uniref:Lipid A biosynthesis lauroyl acyltransferase n=1 Tax=Caenispirillum salinarum AK4 TaxID=1238182 RepID=K9HW89_9PROT|nr:lipid A biosynthesis lauroyl acyltransferase [Caenispirillum salinarum]EKV32496.1 Lipid A biosynthesis lauroyl acyltransferase [Caenispirillum salinarum AK4]